MKYFLIYLFLFTSVFGDNLPQRLEHLLKDKKIKTVTMLKYDPFFTKYEKKQSYKHSFIIQKKTKTKKRKLKLVSILGNRAFIDGRWLGKGNKIHGYKIKKVLQNKVVLFKQNKIKVLRFEKSKDILNVREK